MIDLEDWLAAMTNRLVLQRLGGNKPETDRVRVMLLMDSLDGAAYKWMLRHVTHVNQEIEHWTFKDVVHRLYDRFIHLSSMQDAQENTALYLSLGRFGANLLMYLLAMHICSLLS